MTAHALSTRDAIEADQLDRLRNLVAALVPSNRFYAVKLRDAGLAEGVASLDHFRTLPFTTKQHIVNDQRAHPPFGTNLTFPRDRYTRFNQTSGTTGVPVRWLDTPDSWAWMVDNWKQVFRAADVNETSHDRVYFAFSFGPFLGFWTAYDAAAALGCLCIPGGGLSSKARLRAILDNEATVLCCTPTYALRLAEVARAEGMDLATSSVRRVIVAGEPGGSVPTVRAQIEVGWPSARVVDHHGMTEVGPVSFESPPVATAKENEDTRSLHGLRIIETSYLAEVIDPQTAEPVSSGVPGELVLTTLGRVGSPMLRYRTGDLVKPVPFDRCVHLTLDGGILGRVDDMVLVRGVNVYPSAIDDVIRRFEQVAEYRVTVREQRAMTELSLEIEPVAACPDEQTLGDRIAVALRESLNLRVPVALVTSGTLPRFEMKANRWVRES